MTDPQLLTLAIAVIIPVSLLIYSNSRITEAKETLRADIKATESRLQAQIDALRVEIHTGFEKMETMLKIHELEHHK